MTRLTVFAALGLCASMVLACYELVSTTTVSTTPRNWTGAGHFSMGNAVSRQAVGLAGQDIYGFQASGSVWSWSAPLLAKFGGPHTLTSIAQTHSLGHHEKLFIHGNRVGETDNLDLLHARSLNDLFSVVEAFDPTFWDAGTYHDLVEICDMAAVTLPEYGNPNDLSSHLFLSFRACARNGSGCSGGVLEVQVNAQVNRWWIRSNQEGGQVTNRKADGTRFSNECMPIAVTAYGDQSKDYLVVGDPSWDELSVFDANRLWEGPLDSHRAPDSSRNIEDVHVEGRGDGGLDSVMLSVLWRGSSSAKLEHWAVLGGTFSASPFLVENLSSGVQLISGLGLGAEGTTGDLFTFGNNVVRRHYQRD